MNAFVSAGSGFLLAVLWFDLMFDVQVLGGDEGELPEQTLASIAAYFAPHTHRLDLPLPMLPDPGQHARPVTDVPLPPAPPHA